MGSQVFPCRMLSAASQIEETQGEDVLWTRRTGAKAIFSAIHKRLVGDFSVAKSFPIVTGMRGMATHTHSHPQHSAHVQSPGVWLAIKCDKGIASSPLHILRSDASINFVWRYNKGTPRPRLVLAWRLFYQTFVWAALKWARRIKHSHLLQTSPNRIWGHPPGDKIREPMNDVHKWAGIQKYVKKRSAEVAKFNLQIAINILSLNLNLII